MFTASSSRIATGVLGCLLLVSSAAADAPEIVISDAKIAGGKLQISGTAAAPLALLRLEGRTDAAFNATAKADRSFTFSTVYLPKDCIVSLQRVLPTGALGEATQAVVANCSPVALTPRGAWTAAGTYEPLDLVSHRGSTWLAAQATHGQPPGKSAAWQLFAAAAVDPGDTSATGTTGGTGSSGEPLTALSAAAAAAAAARVAPTGPAGGDLAGTYPNPVIRALAVTTPKIATNAIVTTKIAANAVTTPKIAPNAINASRLAANAVTTTRLLDGAVTLGKIAPDAVDGSKVVDHSLQTADMGLLNGDAVIADNTITTFDLATDSVDSDEVLDFGLSNQDIGVLFAQINADGSVFSSSGSVTALSLGTGTVEVDFGRNVSACAAFATQGEGGIGSASGAIMAVTDRSGNANAYFVTSRNFSGALANAAFQLVVVC